MAFDSTPPDTRRRPLAATHRLVGLPSGALTTHSQSHHWRSHCKINQDQSQHPWRTQYRHNWRTIGRIRDHIRTPALKKPQVRPNSHKQRTHFKNSTSTQRTTTHPHKAKQSTRQLPSSHTSRQVVIKDAPQVNSSKLQDRAHTHHHKTDNTFKAFNTSDLTTATRLEGLPEVSTASPLTTNRQNSIFGRSLNTRQTSHEQQKAQVIHHNSTQVNHFQPTVQLNQQQPDLSLTHNSGKETTLLEVLPKDRALIRRPTPTSAAFLVNSCGHTLSTTTHSQHSTQQNCFSNSKRIKAKTISTQVLSSTHSPLNTTNTSLKHHNRQQTP